MKAFEEDYLLAIVELALTRVRWRVYHPAITISTNGKGRRSTVAVLLMVATFVYIAFRLQEDKYP